MKKKKTMIITAISILLLIIVTISILIPTVFVLKISASNYAFNSFDRSKSFDFFTKVDYNEKSPLRRTINSENPINLVFCYGDITDAGNVWSAIPDDIKPISAIVVFSVSEEFYKIVDEYNFQFVVMIGSGETMIEKLMPIKQVEENYCFHPNFLGVAMAEIYNGEYWRGEQDGDISWYINDVIKLMAKYGSFLFWKDTNIFGDNGNIVDWIEENEFLYDTMRENYSNIFFLNKESYGDASTYSLFKGLYMAKLIGGWGVSTDWWHWQVSEYKQLFNEGKNYIDNEWERIYYYPENMQTMSLAMVASNGGVCYANEANFYATAIKDTRLATFQFSLIPFFRNLVNKEFDIPTREQLLEQESFAIVGGKNYKPLNYNTKESTLYPATASTKIIPLLPINLRQTEKSYFDSNNVKLINSKFTKKIFNDLANKNFSGNTFMTAYNDSIFYLNNLENINKNKTASMNKLPYNNANNLQITSTPHTYVQAKQTNNSIVFTANNYRVDKTEMIKTLSGEAKPFEDVLHWLGVDENNNIKADDSKKRLTTISFISKDFEPTIKSIIDTNGGLNHRSFTYKSNYDANSGIFKIDINHNGYVNFEINLAEGEKNDIYKKDIVTNYNTAIVSEYDYKQVNTLLESKKHIIENQFDYSIKSYHEFIKLYTKLSTATVENNLSKNDINKYYNKLKNIKLISVKEALEVMKNVDIANASEATLRAYDNLYYAILSPTMVYDLKYSTDIEYYRIKLKKYYQRSSYSNLLQYNKTREINYHMEKLKSTLN